MSSTISTFKADNSFRHIFSVALPMMVNVAIPQINQFINSVFLGHYSSNALSILGIAAVYILFIQSIVFAVSSGMLVIFSRFSGEGNTIKIAQHFKNGMTLSAIIALLVFFVNWFTCDLLLKQLVHEKENLEHIISFIKIRSVSLPILMLVAVLNSFYIAIGKAKSILYITLMGSIVHCVLDYLLIYGHFGFPQIGVIGTAYASILSELTMILISVYILFKQGFVKNYKLNFSWKLAPNISRYQLNMCLPLIFQYIFTLGGWLIFFVVIEHKGSVSLASSQLIRTAMGVASIFIWPFTSVSNSFTSNFIGQNKPDMILKTINKVALTSVAFVSFFTILFIVFPHQILSLFTNDQAVIREGITSLQLIGITILVMAYSATFFHGMMGTGQTNKSIIVEIFGVVFYLIYLYYIVFVNQGNLFWAWTSEFIYWVVLIFFSVYYLNSFLKKQNNK